MKRSTFIWPLVALAAVLLFNLILTPGFFAIEIRDGRLFGSLIDVLNRAVPVLLLSIGMTLVIATGGVDLSVGAVMAIAGAVAACLIARPEGCILNSIPVHGSVPLILLVSLGFALVCGLFNGFLVGFLGLQPIVATLLLMVAGRGVAQLLTDGQIVIFTNNEFASLGRGAWLGFPMPVWIFLLTLGVVAFLFRGLALGTYVEATGNNARAAQICGIDARAVKILVYTICALCAGWAGLIGTADIKGADANNLGLYLELDAILAVCIGGTAMTGGRFSLIGSVIGALLMQTLTTTILTRGISPEATLVLKAVVVIVVCLLQSPVLRERSAKEAPVEGGRTFG
ncbi:MAG: ABC transporter permease [Fimbriimonadaceae bacterium]|nr:ABC transporter permease [Fimbriimonadaceae bacterium]